MWDCLSNITFTFLHSPSNQCICHHQAMSWYLHPVSYHSQSLPRMWLPNVRSRLFVRTSVVINVSTSNVFSLVHIPFSLILVFASVSRQKKFWKYLHWSTSWHQNRVSYFDTNFHRIYPSFSKHEFPNRLLKPHERKVGFAKWTNVFLDVQFQ